MNFKRKGKPRGLLYVLLLLVIVAGSLTARSDTLGGWEKEAPPATNAASLATSEPTPSPTPLIVASPTKIPAAQASASAPIINTATPTPLPTATLLLLGEGNATQGIAERSASPLPAAQTARAASSALPTRSIQVLPLSQEPVTASPSPTASSTPAVSQPAVTSLPSFTPMITAAPTPAATAPPATSAVAEATMDSRKETVTILPSFTPMDTLAPATAPPLTPSPEPTASPVAAVLTPPATAEPTQTPPPTPQPTPQPTPVPQPTPTVRPGPTPTYEYTSDSLRLEIIRHESDQLVYFATEIWLSDITQLRSAFSQDEFDSSTEIVQDIAVRNNALIAFNGDFATFNNGGIIIRNGEVFRRNRSTRQLMLIDREGNFIPYIVPPENSEEMADQFAQQGIWHTFVFGPVLVQDGQAVTLPSDFFISMRAKEPRTAIGQLGPLHYLVLVVDGRQDGYSRGVTLGELQQMFLDHGALTAFNLDGGGSTTLFYDGNVLNSPANGGQRRVPDILYISRE